MAEKKINKKEEKKVVSGKKSDFWSKLGDKVRDAIDCCIE